MMLIMFILALNVHALRGSHTKREAQCCPAPRLGQLEVSHTFYTNKSPEVCCNGCVLVNPVGGNR